MCLHVAAFTIPFNLICNMPYSEKKILFDPTPKGGGLLTIIAAMLLAAFVVLISLLCSIDNVLKKLKFDPTPRVGGGIGLLEKYILPRCCVCHSL